MRKFLFSFGLVLLGTGLMAQLAGSYTIDPSLPASATNFQTIDSAVGSLNQSGVSAAVTFNIKQGTYNEQVIISAIAGTSPTNTVTFQPDPTNTLPVVISFAATASTNNYIVRINTTKYLNFNGLTFTAGGTSFGRIIEIQEGDTLGFNNNIFNGVPATPGSTNTAILFGSGTTTKRIQGLTITNNTFNGGGHVVYFTTSVSNRNQWFTLNNNTMTGFGGYGCYLTYCETFEAIGNTMEASASSTSTMYGIYLLGSTTVANPNIRAVVKDNEITLPTTGTAYGIYLSGFNAPMGSPSEVINNLVSIGSNGTGTRYALFANNNNYLNVWHNSFLVRDGSATSSRGIFFGRSATGFTSGNNDVRNNVSVNNGTGYAAEISTDVTTVPGFFTNLNYNAYFGNGLSPFRYGATNHADLTAWKTATSAEVNSVWGDPQFTSNTNLRALGTLLNNAGANVGVLTDIDGDARSVTTPDIGGDEFTPATCLPPTGLNIASVTPGGATVNWTTSGGTNFDVQYGLAGFTPGTGTVVPATGTSFNLTGLNPNTSYDVWVRENCGAQQSVYAGPISFKTLCVAFTAPFTESFDTVLIPQCWATFNNAGSTAVQALWRNTSSSWMGFGATGKADRLGTPGSYAMGVDGSTPVVGLNKVTLESPLINVSGLTTPYLKFFVFMNNVDNPGDNQSLYVDLWNGSTWIDSIIVYAADNAAWVELNKDLSTYTITGPIQLRFNVDKTKPATAFYSDLIIDDISVIEAPSCPPPTGLGVFNITEVTASAYFTSGGATNARIQFGPTGFTLGAGTLVTTTNDTVVLPGLTTATNYDMYVQDSCGAGNTSAWVGPVAFSTPACPASSTCAYGADLVDSFGDGWNGGLIGLRQNGVISATFGSGFTSGSSATASPSICDSLLTEIVVVDPGSYPLEMGFTLKSPSGTALYTLVPNTPLTAGQVLVSFTSQCSVQFCPISDTVTTINGSTCGNTSATLGAVLTNPNYNVVWFNNDTNQVGTGYSFSTPPLSASANFWAGYVAGDGNPAQSVGPPHTIGTNTTSGNFTNGIFFTALAPIRIDSMQLRALNGGVIGNIRIWDTTGAGGAGFNPGAPGTLVASVPFNIPAGVSQVAVGADIMPGNYFANVQFLAGTTGQLFRTTGGASYPYTLANTVSITGTDFPTQTRYYYLFEWVVSTTCLGPLSPASALWQPLPSTALPYVENYNSGLPCNWGVSTVNPTGASWEGINAYNGTSTLDGTPFVILDDDGAGSAAITNSTLVTPVFDAAGYDSLWISFDHYYRHLTGSSGKVEVFNGTSWITLQTYSATTGAWSNPDSAYFNLKPYQNAQLQVRFVYDDGNAYAWYWALDNFRLEGVKTPCSDVIVHVVTDIYGSEVSWSVVDSASGSVLATGGPYADVNPYSVAAATHIDTLCLPLNSTFIFTLNDSYGDGLVDGTNTGTYAVMRTCPQGLDTVLSGAGALPFGGVGTPPVLAFDSVVFDLTCPAIPTYNVTFQVNMNQQTVSPNGVYLAGVFQGWTPGGTAMSDANADGIWDVTVAMPAGAIEYKFLNDSAWSGAESVPNACQQNGNRFANITGDTTLAVVCFNQCTDCAPLVNVTFRVDMSQVTVSANGVHVAGNFQGFNPASTPMTDADGDDVYEVTVQVPSNDTLLYKFINDNTFTGVENSSLLASCGQDDGFGGYNRKTGVGTADTTLNIVCFTLCEGCPFGLDDPALAGGFAVFPNPNHGQFTVEFNTPREGNYELEVLDLTGRILYRETVKNHTGYYRKDLNLNRQPAGMYMVRLTGEQGQVVRRVAIH